MRLKSDPNRMMFAWVALLVVFGAPGGRLGGIFGYFGRLFGMFFINFSIILVFLELPRRAF